MCGYRIAKTKDDLQHSAGYAITASGQGAWLPRFFLMTARDMKTFEVFINSELRELKEWCNIKNNSTKLNLGQNQAFVRSPKMYLKV